MIMVEMFRRVGLSKEEFENFDLKEDRWYEKHSWTFQEQESFVEWLGKFLLAHKYVGKRKYRNQDHGKYEAAKFVFDYGWKVNNWNEWNKDA